ncbi:amino acid--tRNA ligase-related protein [Streptacidiphilus sp. MAP5-3]|uniref:amino acid--tRNA ligase-related protein n=1 Tax=unclassified Streptacidiphilus TaxID=2643834 RepID=UPI003517AFCF
MTTSPDIAPFETPPPSSGSRRLAAQMSATHGQGHTATWDAAGELLDAAKLVFTATPDEQPETTADLLAGIARLLQYGPFGAVPLHAATAQSPVHAALRPERPLGPPEEDVLLHALSHAAPPGTEPWPDSQPDPARLAEAVRALTGAIPCRTVPLRATAIRYLLSRLPGADAALRRRLLRRAAWLLDPRTDDALTLLLRLTGPTDPLIATITVGPRAFRPAASPGSFALSDWARWESARDAVRLSGRIHALRVHRRLTFADLRWEGQLAQLALTPEAAQDVHTGDLATVRGIRGESRTGQPTLFVEDLEYLQSGAIPESTGAELRTVLGPVRSQLAAAGFVETITPTLSDSYFGGGARPFATWAAAAEQHQYLRVTTELGLLQTLSSGTTRCYEIGPSFRNEGLRGQPAKEFLMLEAYAADLDLQGLSQHIVALVRAAATYPAPLRTLTFDSAFHDLSGIDPRDSASVRRLARELVPVTAARTDDPDLLARRLWRNSIRSRLPGLALITSIPGPASPLIDGVGRAAQRMWLYADGIEIAELSQNERSPAALANSFREQFARDPYPVHRDYRSVIAMFENGVPPCVGVGLSITRLAELSSRHTPPTIPASRRSQVDAPASHR